MKNYAKTPEIDEILWSFNALRMQKVVQTQGDFAKLLGIYQNTLSAILNQRAGYKPQKALDRVRDIMREKGLQYISVNGSTMTGNNNIGGTQVVTDSTAALINEMTAQREMYAEHISRLLSIIERQQTHMQ